MEQMSRAGRYLFILAPVCAAVFGAVLRDCRRRSVPSACAPLASISLLFCPPLVIAGRARGRSSGSGAFVFSHDAGLLSGRPRRASELSIERARRQIGPDKLAAGRPGPASRRTPPGRSIKNMTQFNWRRWFLNLHRRPGLWRARLCPGICSIARSRPPLAASAGKLVRRFGSAKSPA